MKLKPLRILITDANELAGLGAIRSLGRAGHNIIGGYARGLLRPPGARSRYLSEELTYPDPWVSQPAFQDWLLFHTTRHRFDVILPISEAAVFGTAAIRPFLSHKMIALLPSDSSLNFTLSKFHATRLAMDIGIPCPPTVFVSDGTANAPWDTDVAGLCFPIVIKTDNRLLENGSYAKGRTQIALDPNQASQILRDLQETPAAVIAQEMIPGTGAGSFFLQFGNQTHLAFSHERLHEVPYWGGWSSLRESTRDRDLIELGRYLLEAIDYEGAAMVEFRKSVHGRRPYFLEINGRLWGSLALALHCGVDFPKALLECYLNGQPAQPLKPYPAGVKCRNIFPGEIEHVLSIMRSECKIPEVIPPSKFKALSRFIFLSLNPFIKHDYFWLSDPAPAFAQIFLEAINRMVKLAERLAAKWQGSRQLWRLRLLKWRHTNKCGRFSCLAPPLERVLFVCYGNICRSAFAESYWNGRLRELGLDGPLAASCGFHKKTGRRTPARIADISRMHNVDLRDHRSRILTKELVEEADAIFVMDRQNYKDLTLKFPWAKRKTYSLAWFVEGKKDEIEDPYALNDSGVHRCFETISQALNSLQCYMLQPEDSLSPLIEERRDALAAGYRE